MAAQTAWILGQLLMHPLLSIFEIRGFDSPSANIFQQWISENLCPKCGARIQEKSFSDAAIWVGSGSRWPDVVSNIDSLLFHERVVQTLVSNNIAGFEAYPVKIEKIESKKLSVGSPPAYYLLKITGRIDVDVTQLDDEGGSVCPLCFARNAGKGNSYRWKEKRIVPKLATWDGSDLIKIRNWRTGMKYCSKKFIDLANQHKWTNFVFGQSLPGVGLWEKPQKAINGLTYFDPHWYEKLTERVKAKHPDLFA